MQNTSIEPLIATFQKATSHDEMTSASYALVKFLLGKANPLEEINQTTRNQWVTAILRYMKPEISRNLQNLFTGTYGEDLRCMVPSSIGFILVWSHIDATLLAYILISELLEEPFDPLLITKLCPPSNVMSMVKVSDAIHYIDTLPEHQKSLVRAMPWWEWILENGQES